MPATPLKIGPFTGGLNSYSDPTSVGDAECVDIANFDIDLDGSLYSRFPIIAVGEGSNYPGDGAIYLLGWFIWTNGDRYLIYSTASGTYLWNEETSTASVLTITFSATAMVQYANKAWLIAPASSANPGGSWDPTAGFVADADIPKGNTCVIYKERLFVSGSGVNANRVYFSNAADFGTWNTSVNFFDARSGDGQSIVKLIVFQDTVVIFKENATYVFSYDSSPSRGAVRVINTAIGTSNKYCVIEYENSLYVHHDDAVYQLANWNFTMINLKVPFKYVQKFASYPTEASLSILSDRLIVHHYDNVYVFNLRNATWTTWEHGVAVNFNYFLQVPKRLPTESEKYYAGCRREAAATYNRVLFKWEPTYSVGSEEVMTCRVVTKTFDFNVAYTFKRLYWWGVDILNKSNMSYTVHPVQYTRGVTHDDMATKTHDELSAGSHLQPFSVSIDVSDSMTISNSVGNRMFVKLLKSMRFRQVYFTISGTTTGTLITSPFRIYSVVAFIDNKQLVSKKVS